MSRKYNHISRAETKGYERFGLRRHEFPREYRKECPASSSTFSQGHLIGRQEGKSRIHLGQFPEDPYAHAGTNVDEIIDVGS
jgi:hypothetical protein